MFIIMQPNYVAACFAEKADAEAFMEKTGRRKGVLSVRELPVQYPFYIAEYVEKTMLGAMGARFWPIFNDESLRFILDGLADYLYQSESPREALHEAYALLGIKSEDC